MSTMIKKLCLSCGRFCWHNPTKDAKESRCTFCGTPVNTGPKREINEETRRKQIMKPIKG